jgi:cellobiose-specific phosphotransferase system component IIB
MELFQNLSLVCLAGAVMWLMVRVRNMEERANKTSESSGHAVSSQETKEIGRSAAAGR